MTKLRPVADAHNDLLQRALAGDDISQRLPDGHSDFQRFNQANVNYQILSVWVPVKYEREKQSFFHANRLIDAFEKALDNHGHPYQSITRLQSPLVNHNRVIFLGMEGGHPIENKLSNLDHFFNRGVRYLSPTWNNSTDWATSAADESKGGMNRTAGLTEFGRQVIERMNEIGIVPDVSHVGDTTFTHMIECSQRPVIASHSASRSLCNHYRNLTDGQIRQIAETGGVVFVNFFSGFLMPGVLEKKLKLTASEPLKKQLQMIQSGGKNYEQVMIQSDRLIGQYADHLRPPLSVLLDHFMHIIHIAGVDHVGIGTDFDGIDSPPQGMDSILDIWRLYDELSKRGLSDDQIDKITCQNFLRIFG